MEKVSKFLKLIHADDEILTRVLSADELPEEELGKLASDYNSKRASFIEASTLEPKKRQIEDQAILNYNKKVMKSVNKSLALGLTNEKIDEFKTIDDFYDFAGKNISKQIQDSRTTTDEQLRKDIDTYKQSLSTLTLEKEQILAGVEEKIESTRKHYAEEARISSAKILIKDIISKDKEIAETNSKDFLLETIEEKLVNNYIVNGKGEIKNLDGTVVLHPERQVVISHVSDMYAYLKGKAGLNKNSNGSVSIFRDGKVVEVASSGESVAVTKKMKEFQELRQRRQG